MKLGFLSPSTLYPNFVLRTRNETFCEHKGLLRVFDTAIYRRPSKNFGIFLLNSSFLERFSVEKDGFFAVSSLEKVIFEFFWHCKIDKIFKKK